MLAKWVDFEVNFLAVRPYDDLTLQVHRDARVATEFAVVNQLLANRARQADRQDAVLEAVVEEDVSEIRCDDAANAEIEQSPGCMLARGAAAEILVGDDDLGFTIRLLVQHEVGVFRAVLPIS